MRTLIIGDITGCGEYLSCYLSRKRHTVILVDLFNSAQENMNIRGKIIFKEQSPAHVQALYDSFDYDNVIFLPAPLDFYCKDMAEMIPADRWLGDFVKTLDKCVEKKIKKLIFCSSLYTSSTDLEARVEGISYVWDMKMAEEYCLKYQKVFGLNCLCLKLPAICCTKGTGNFEKMILNAVRTGLIVKYGAGSDYLELISDVDLCQIIYRSMIMDIRGSREVYGEGMEQLHLQLLIGKKLNLNCQMVPAKLPKMPKAGKRFLEEEIKYQLLDSADKALSRVVSAAKAKKTQEIKHTQNKNLLQKVLPWALTLLGGVAVQLIISTSVGKSIMAPANYLLIYVVVVAAICGIKQAVLAIALSIAAYFISRGLNGTSFLQMFIVPENIGAAIVFSSVGLLVGYGVDTMRRRTTRTIQDNEVLSDKLRFLTEYLRMTTAQNSELERQIEDYSDSFNNIYTVAKELDHTQPERVLISAIDVLEIALHSDSVSIYLLNKNNLGYARLMACSKREQEENVASSLNMSLYPEIFSTLFTNEAYINKTMDKNYPAYAMYLYDGAMPIALIVVNQVEFEKYNSYYVNIFRVITGLIQTSLSHACRVFDPNNDSKYLLNSKILSTEALMEKYEAKKQLKLKKNMDFTPLLIRNEKLTISEASVLAKTLLRESDDIGLGNDGRYYVLLSSTNETDAQRVVDRFKEKAIDAIMVENI